VPRLRSLLTASVLILSGEAGAQADLARATCAGLNDLRRPERADILLWLHGYYAGAAQRSVLDRKEVAAALNAVEAACEREPTMALIGSEARSLFLGEPPLRRDPPASAAAPSPVPSGESARPAGTRPTPIR
jgi:hypothetical protein